MENHRLPLLQQRLKNKQVHLCPPPPIKHQRNEILTTAKMEALPSNPVAHTHVKLLSPSMQVAMFRHG
jgi:hypothetical protein